MFRFFHLAISNKITEKELTSMNMTSNLPPDVTRLQNEHRHLGIRHCAHWMIMATSGTRNNSHGTLSFVDSLCETWFFEPAYQLGLVIVT